MQFRNISICILFLVSGFPSKVLSQSVPLDTLHKYGIFDTDRLTPEFHRSRRELLRKFMAPHSAAIFLAASPKNRSNDVSYVYHQDPNFYYLTGHTRSDAALIITKEPFTINGITTNEILFVQKKEPAREIWTGVRLGVEGAKHVLGFQNALVIDSLAAFLNSLLPTIDTLYLGDHFAKEMTEPILGIVINSEKYFRDSLLKKYPSVSLGTLHKRLGVMRSVKEDEELVLLRKAIKISNDAHNEIIKSVRAGWTEYQMQALGEYIFTRNGCEYTGYPCIVGSGNNSTILHYETNRRKTWPGDFVEMDIGGEYHGYTADITRSFPVNGKFSPAQRKIYDLVLEAQDSGIAEAKVGNDFKAPHRAAVSVITRGLISLGIITKPADYKKYFMHGTSHYLGLDVHDAGDSGPLKARQVITVEPGIYIAEGSDCNPVWWRIGCRIEDDILISTTGPEILSKRSPRKADEIEKLMRRK
ncbi:MAG: aminopeptidase P N-terminal domain-containing protein [Ignavibacteriota bacterium]